MAATDKNKKIIKTSEQISILKSFFEKGMVNCSKSNTESKKMIKEAVEKTGLSKKTVTQWINNQGKEQRPREKVQIRQPRSYDIFRSEYMKNADGNHKEKAKAANLAWHALSDEDKKTYEASANTLEPILNFNEMSRSQQLKLIKITRNKIEQLCEKMSSMGVETCVLEFDRSDLNAVAYGSEVGVAWVEETKSDSGFSFFCSGTTKETIDRKKIREEVQKALNQKFYECTGQRYTRVSYTKINSGEFFVHGLPPGFQLRCPNSMTLEEIKLVKENIDNIYFTARDAAAITTVQVEESRPPPIKEARDAATITTVQVEESRPPPIKKARDASTITTVQDEESRSSEFEQVINVMMPAEDNYSSNEEEASGCGKVEERRSTSQDDSDEDVPLNVIQEKIKKPQ